MELIKVEKRDASKSAKQLRKLGLIPCSVYGGQLEKDIPLQMTQKAAEQMFRTKLVGSTLQLELDGRKIPVQIKEKAHDCLGTRIEHIAFEALKADVPVHSVAHIFLQNEDKVPGLLEQLLFEVPFTALPADLVETVHIDVQGKPVGTDILVSDLPELMAPSITLGIPADSLILRIREHQAAPEEEEASGDAQ